MKLLRDTKLDNGMHLAFYDDSKQVAGDRWLVVLKLVLTMPLEEDMLREFGTTEEGAYLLNKFEGKLSSEIERKKHFVDQNDVVEALDELMTQAESNMIDYLGRRDYVYGLFRKKLEQFRELYAQEMHFQQIEQGLSSEENEPDDFSGCFK